MVRPKILSLPEDISQDLRFEKLPSDGGSFFGWYLVGAYGNPCRQFDSRRRQSPGLRGLLRKPHLRYTSLFGRLRQSYANKDYNPDKGTLALLHFRLQQKQIGIHLPCYKE
jgi:hypothetical protein